MASQIKHKMFISSSYPYLSAIILQPINQKHRFNRAVFLVLANYPHIFVGKSLIKFQRGNTITYVMWRL